MFSPPRNGLARAMLRALVASFWDLVPRVGKRRGGAPGFVVAWRARVDCSSAIGDAWLFRYR
jgi:hypothetical protein